MLYFLVANSTLRFRDMDLPKVSAEHYQGLDAYMEPDPEEDQEPPG